tara:strand:+ start:769 stop:1233 length:465 start_codon:yes stop_codon:yes gene_type:complete
MNNNSIECFLLVGLPASGKSTFSKRLALSRNALIISTDNIRKMLYKDETKQGDWKEIERVLHDSILKSVSKGQSVIVDATHTVREHRKILINLSNRINWTCYFLNTDKQTCIKRNLERSRTVPKHVIESMANQLELTPPKKVEGFKKLYEINLK